MRDDLDLKARRRKEAGVLRLSDGGHEALLRPVIFPAEIRIDGARAYGVGGDDDALDQQVRIVLEDRTVLEGPRLALVGVDDQVDGLVRIPGNESPLAAGRESGTAAAAQARFGDERGDAVGLHGAKRTQRCVGAVSARDLELVQPVDPEVLCDNSLHHASFNRATISSTRSVVRSS